MPVTIGVKLSTLQYQCTNCFGGSCINKYGTTFQDPKQNQHPYITHMHNTNMKYYMYAMS